MASQATGHRRTVHHRVKLGLTEIWMGTKWEYKTRLIMEYNGHTRIIPHPIHIKHLYCPQDVAASPTKPWFPGVVQHGSPVAGSHLFGGMARCLMTGWWGSFGTNDEHRIVDFLHLAHW